MGGGRRVGQVIAELKFDVPKLYKFHKKDSVDVAVDVLRLEKSATCALAAPRAPPPAAAAAPSQAPPPPPACAGGGAAPPPPPPSDAAAGATAVRDSDGTATPAAEEDGDDVLNHKAAALALEGEQGSVRWCSS